MLDYVIIKLFSFVENFINREHNKTVELCRKDGQVRFVNNGVVGPKGLILIWDEVSSGCFVGVNPDNQERIEVQNKELLLDFAKEQSALYN